jgi:hypothetical protein
MCFIIFISKRIWLDFSNAKPKNFVEIYQKIPKHSSFIFASNEIKTLLNRNMYGLKELFKSLFPLISCISLYDQELHCVNRVQDIDLLASTFGYMAFIDQATNNVIVTKSNCVDKKTPSCTVLADGKESMLFAYFNGLKFNFVPELVFVVGGYSLRFYAYCPILLANSEIIHIPFLDFYGKIHSADIIKGFRHYSTVDQRMGK